MSFVLLKGGKVQEEQLNFQHWVGKGKNIRIMSPNMSN